MLAQIALKRPLRSFSLALNLLDDFTEQVFAVSSERQRQAYFRQVVSYVEIFLSFVSQHLSRDERAVAVLFNLMIKYKAIGPELLAIQRETILSQERPEFAEKLVDLVRLRARISEIELSDQRGKRSSVRLLDRWKKRREQIESKLATALGEVSNTQLWRNCSAQSVEKAIPPGSALIEIFRGHGYSFSAVPSRGEARVMGLRYYACILSTARHEQRDADAGDVLRDAEWCGEQGEQEPDDGTSQRCDQHGGSTEDNRRRRDVRQREPVDEVGRKEEGNLSFVDLGDAEPIDALISSFRASITGKVERRAKERSDKTVLAPNSVSASDERPVLRTAI